MKIYLVRHAQRGWGKNYDTLDKIGIIQAKRLGPYFKNKKVDIVYCSENERAIQTLKYIRPFLNKRIKIIITKDIRQHNVPEEVGKEAIKEFDLKIESEKNLIERTKRFLNFLKKNHKSDSVLIVSHKEVIKFLICQIFGRPFKESVYIDKLPSASISYFEFDNNFKLKSPIVGDLAHLMKK